MPDIPQIEIDASKLRGCRKSIKVIYDRSTALVNSLTGTISPDVFEIRVVLERLAVELFIKNFHQENAEELEKIIEKMEEAVQENNFMEAAKMNNRFHDFIIEKSGNHEIINVMEPLKNKINIFRLISISTPSRLKKSLAEHRDILISISRNDVEDAKKLLEIHIRKVLSIIEKKLLEKKDNFIKR